MNKKSNWQEFQQVLEQNGIKKLYHFTDRDNLKSIIENGGLYSWADCEEKNIKIAKPGGGLTSRELDRRDNLHHFVRVSFVKNHPMQYVAMNDGRISNPVILEIDPEVIFLENSKYADRNATKNGAQVGDGIDDFKKIHFKSVKASVHFDLDDDEKMFYQAEILVKNFIPLQYITNIKDFGIPIPQNPTKLESKEAYTALITRDTPTAFVFLVDHSVSMNRSTTYNGENMTMSEAVSRIINSHIKELVQRCVKGNEIRHYYDIAVIGYGDNAYSGWIGPLEGKWFVSPKEIYENPYEKILTRKEVRTRRGVEVKEVEIDQWIKPRHDGSWTYLHKAMDKAYVLLSDWLEDHKGKCCYPPTIINITDGEYNGASRDVVLQKSNELRSMSTNDGNVIFINIHLSLSGSQTVIFPTGKNELNNDALSEKLYELSSLLPLRYNTPISELRGDVNDTDRHVGLAVNVDVSLLTKLMEIGTPTNLRK